MFARSVAHVQAGVRCAVAAGVRPVPRAGGQSFEALSTGDSDTLVLDLSAGLGVVVSVDVGRMAARVQGGARMGNVYAAVAAAGRAASPPRNLSCLGGVWPQLGFAGLMLAGGYGSMSRKYGVLADHVTAVRVVDSRGAVLAADATTNPELFFALRGGGGGTYGVVVEATVRLLDVPLVTLGHVVYRGLDSAAELLDRCGLIKGYGAGGEEGGVSV
jgi:FAD/FMN-containing dehydrogenase